MHAQGGPSPSGEKSAGGLKMMRGFWHVSFTVSNIEASVKWYTEVLGLEFVRDQIQQNEYTSKLVGYADAHLKVAGARGNHSAFSPSH